MVYVRLQPQVAFFSDVLAEPHPFLKNWDQALIKVPRLVKDATRLRESGSNFYLSPMLEDPGCHFLSETALLRYHKYFSVCVLGEI